VPELMCKSDNDDRNRNKMSKQWQQMEAPAYWLAFGVVEMDILKMMALKEKIHTDYILFLVCVF
jgi:hypothetical protein